MKVGRPSPTPYPSLKNINPGTKWTSNPHLKFCLLLVRKSINNKNKCQSYNLKYSLNRNKKDPKSPRKKRKSTLLLRFIRRPSPSIPRMAVKVLLQLLCPLLLQNLKIKLKLKRLINLHPKWLT